MSQKKNKYDVTSIIGIIPARYSSKRLPAKLTLEIGGKPIIQHTYENALKSRLLNEVYVAVDDDRLAEICESFGAKYFITPKDLNSGSDRVAYVIKNFLEADIIVNIQGDEPFISSNAIDKSVEPLLFDQKVEVSTLITPITEYKELENSSTVKVVFDYENYALYFSRSKIPFIRDAKSNRQEIQSGLFYKHIGIYAFRKNALIKFVSYPQTDLENAEKLEQLRMLEMGMKIKVVQTDYSSISIDTIEDLRQARKYYNKLKNHL
ncbi:MAG: 3-deoxy-manno-octulosonate cytidylyltransferase [Ignavibacterium sp.]|nr:3-deoxy-manno-octulosonate cytidylyltransferase [Ignavibacterium sp.]